ncbi:hypothetical protein SAMN05428959_106217 [Duganella sp. CF517]|uniref:hypothetical protein n=1 Tax=Duganella sp. CF517 TaxID=1881038 RepID=UPI0008D2B578|nr:hypothetical protein [Duganella sp. CF517]SEO30681.1 hypothetical protein SAMN05428959_106217 [Duganella sp. CF517]
MSATFTVGGPARPRRPGMAWGVAVSVVLHALLIFGYRLTAPPAPAELPPKEMMTVWLVPPRKAPAPAPVLARLDPPPAKRVRPRERANMAEVARAGKPAPADTAEDRTAQAITLPAPPSNAPDPLYPEQTQQQARQFDMDAALKTARKVANEKDPARAGLPVAQLDDHPLYPERTATELATKMEGAKRKSCLNQPGGNLLTPLFWLLEKKDHGCKL